MAKANRELAHRMLDELEDNNLPEVIRTMRDMMNSDNKFRVAEASAEEIEAIKRARKEFENGEYYSHKELFGDSDV